jgi:Zn-dependent peptidase ImmA (M78 family)
MITEDIERSEGFKKENKERLIDPDNIKRLSKYYKVSKHSLMFRLHNLKIVTDSEYYEFLNKTPFKKKVKKSSSGGDYYNTQRDRLSRKYIELVYNNYSDGNISITDTFSYLGVKDFDRVNQFMEVVDNG